MKTGLLELFSKIVWPLSADRNDKPEGFFKFKNIRNCFKRQIFKIQAVGHVIVGRYGFRIAVDDDGLFPVTSQGERSMHARPVKFHRGADMVRSTTQNNNCVFSKRSYVMMGSMISQI